MPPEHKIWAVIDVIVETSRLAPDDQPLEIDPTELEKIMTASDLRQILKKLQADEGIIEIRRDPTDFAVGLDGVGEKNYVIAVPDGAAFMKYYDSAHHKFFGSIEKLSGENFFAVVDVAKDIHEALEMTSSNQITIPIKREIIRFQILYPGHSVNMMNRYCDLRVKGVRYLLENGHIQHFEINKDHWDSTIRIELDRSTFTRFFKRLLDVYPKRVKDETVDDPHTQEGGFHFDHENGILHKDGHAKTEHFPENKEHALLKIAFGLPIGERIDAMTDGVELAWTPLRDAARRVNEKVNKLFGDEVMFEIDFKNKFLKRTL